MTAVPLSAGVVLGLMLVEVLVAREPRRSLTQRYGGVLIV